MRVREQDSLTRGHIINKQAWQQKQDRQNTHWSTDDEMYLIGSLNSSMVGKNVGASGLKNKMVSYNHGRHHFEIIIRWLNFPTFCAQN